MPVTFVPMVPVMNVEPVLVPLFVILPMGLMFDPERVILPVFVVVVKTLPVPEIGPLMTRLLLPPEPTKLMSLFKVTGPLKVKVCPPPLVCTVRAPVVPATVLIGLALDEPVFETNKRAALLPEVSPKEMAPVLKPFIVTAWIKRVPALIDMGYELAVLLLCSSIVEVVLF